MLLQLGTGLQSPSSAVRRGEPPGRGARQTISAM